MKAAALTLCLAAASCGPAPAPAPAPSSFKPTAIVIHSTSGLDGTAALKHVENRIHILIGSDGTEHRLLPLDHPGRAARGLDDVAIHVSVVGGVGAELRADPRLLESAARVIRDLSSRYSIPLSNADVISRRGVFSHQQCKYRYGGWKRGEAKGRMEPGEDFMKALLLKAGGRFFEERDWIGRADEGWVAVWEGGSLGHRGDLSKGRGLTPAPAKPPAPLQMAENRRMRYVDRGAIDVRGIVLHFTATRTWDEAVATFERRRLGPSIIVDTDGRAWQVVDRLEDKVAAAAGTNEHCIQVEIVGDDEEALLANDRQRRGVVELLKALAKQRSIPLTNADIDSQRGVFSHGQAKKRWGRSAWMWGSDFDPGERYMKRVLEDAGGVYVLEKDWVGRRSGEWVIEDEDWTP